MRLEYDQTEADRYWHPGERSVEPWTATSDDGDYDASGATPLDAVAGLCAVLESWIEAL
jgi:hypothetical protein